MQIDDIPPEQHALVPAFPGSGGKRIHPLPFTDSHAVPGKSDSGYLDLCQFSHLRFDFQCNPDPWIRRKIWLRMAMEAWPGKRGWRAGSRGRRECS